MRSIVCVVFQNAIAMHESNGIDIIIALVLSEISMDLVLELKVGNLWLNIYLRTLHNAGIFTFFKERKKGYKNLKITCF